MLFVPHLLSQVDLNFLDSGRALQAFLIFQVEPRFQTSRLEPGPMGGLSLL